VLLESELQDVVLDGQTLAQGAAAEVVELPGWPGLVGKVFRDPEADLADRLEAMLAQPPVDTQDGPTVAWPLDRLLAVGQYQKCIGYTMRRVAGVSLGSLWTPGGRWRPGPRFPFVRQLHVARGLAGLLRKMHAQNHVAGALHPGKVLVDGQGSVAIVGVDAFQIQGQGRVFPCRRVRSAYQPPELQGAAEDTLRRPEHDAFSLAVVIYQLLVLGQHPFAGEVGACADLGRRIAAGSWSRSRPGFAMLPPAVQKLFRRGFEEAALQPALRPDPSAWEGTLGLIEAQITTCPHSPNHQFHRDLRGCPWCAWTWCHGWDPYAEPPPVESQAAATSTGPTALAKRSTALPAAATKADSPAGVCAQKEQADMPALTDNFDLIVDSLPEAPVPIPPAVAPAAAVAMPPPPAPAPAPAEPPATGPAGKASRNRWVRVLFPIIALALVGNGVVLAKRYGLIVEWPWASPATPGPGPSPSDPQGTPPGAGPKNLADKRAVDKTARPFRSLKDALAAVQEHLQNTPLEDRRFQRYVSLAHIHNNPQRSDAELETHRKALDKLIACLASNKDTASLEPLDQARTVFAVDLRVLGWDKDGRWRSVMRSYPYAVLLSESRREEVAELAREIYDLAACDVPMVHGDWFIATASRGELFAALSKGAAAAGEPAPEIEHVKALYDQPVTLQEASAELGLEDVTKVKNLVQNDARLRRLGLEPLAREQTIGRQAWASLEGTASLYQRLARELDLGTPYRVLD
jgi:hypothetical protein